MVMITEPFQTDLNIWHTGILIKQNYSIVILSHKPCNHCSRNCTMGKFASRHYLQRFIIEIVHFSISLLWVLHTFHLWSCEESATAVRRSFFSSWIFQSRWKSRSWEALFIEVLLTQAQVSPGAAQNSLCSLSAQAILMGIPFPHALGCPTQVGWSAVNAPFRKPTAVRLSSGDVMHHSRISSWTFYLQYHVLQF